MGCMQAAFITGIFNIPRDREGHDVSLSQSPLKDEMTHFQSLWCMCVCVCSHSTIFDAQKCSKHTVIYFRVSGHTTFVSQIPNKSNLNRMMHNLFSLPMESLFLFQRLLMRLRLNTHHHSSGLIKHFFYSSVPTLNIGTDCLTSHQTINSSLVC